MKSKISPEKHAEMLANLTAAYIASPQTDNRSALDLAKKTLEQIIDSPCIETSVQAVEDPETTKEIVEAEESVNFTPFFVRGFQGYKFTDGYGNECSIQKSSLATEDAIWFGVSDAKPEVMAMDADRLGVETKETSGWVPYPIPSEVSLHTRMHLTQDQVKALLPALIHFSETGELPTDSRHD